jgi:hypothetical protein
MIREAKRASYYVIRFNFIKFSAASHNARCKFPIHHKLNEMNQRDQRDAQSQLRHALEVGLENLASYLIRRT